MHHKKKINRIFGFFDANGILNFSDFLKNQLRVLSMYASLTCLLFLMCKMLIPRVFLLLNIVWAQTVLCAIGEVASMRFVLGDGPRPGIMGIDFSTAFWLYLYVLNTSTVYR